MFSKQQELRWTLISYPSGYVCTTLQSSSPPLQDRGIPNDQATAPAARLVSNKSKPSGMHTAQSSNMRPVMRQTASHGYRCTIPAKPRSNAKRPFSAPCAVP
ncbi:hypothetical protein CDL15_Pgr005115 [Punica granatum]|uniref:Uncharacterized protein n=1 Tax=Punica granatum TaxID=22663 RepID=A0A218WPH0_PUNGR|nr:hypothetical protein CDL15_Pgr005115 [Punica granatum]PKI50463.1 hypothetical protein CRG98_029146 [Punica granatum]